MIDREAKTKKKEQENIQGDKDNFKKEILYKMVLESIKKDPLI
jgi:hypothetical protein